MYNFHLVLLKHRKFTLFVVRIFFSNPIISFNNTSAKFENKILINIKEI